MNPIYPGKVDGRILSTTGSIAGGILVSRPSPYQHGRRPWVLAYLRFVDGIRFGNTLLTRNQGYRPFVMRTNDDKERNPFADAYSMYMRPSILPTIDDAKSESLLRVSSRKQCEIIVTPLVVMAIPPLVQGFYSDVRQILSFLIL